jgi:hypothetical protein
LSKHCSQFGFGCSKENWPKKIVQGCKRNRSIIHPWQRQKHSRKVNTQVEGFCTWKGVGYKGMILSPVSKHTFCNIAKLQVKQLLVDLAKYV